MIAKFITLGVFCLLALAVWIGVKVSQKRPHRSLASTQPTARILPEPEKDLGMEATDTRLMDAIVAENNAAARRSGAPMFGVKAGSHTEVEVARNQRRREEVRKR